MARKIYTQEFKDAAVRLAAQTDVTLKAVADELGVTPWSLRRGIKEAAKSPQVRRDESDLRAQLRALEAENRRLRMERDILKKATAFFAKEQP